MANEKKVYEIVAQPRTITGKASRHPATREFYFPPSFMDRDGHREFYRVPPREFDVVYLRAGSNNLVDLKIGEKGKAQQAFINESPAYPTTP